MLRELLKRRRDPGVARADAIGQFYERGEDGMVDVLVDLEADSVLRAEVVILL